jgi:hypothetical protein
MIVLEVVTVTLVAIAMALSLAHALEFPGKLRLPEGAYRAVQTIYYPGFTIGGFFGDVGGAVALLILTVATPYGAPSFWLTLGALLCLVALNIVYWTVTHPTNKVWVKDVRLSGAGEKFFTSGGSGREAKAADWVVLRDRWEYSHVARAVLAMLSLILLAAAVSL